MLLQPVHLSALLVLPEQRMAELDVNAPLGADIEAFRLMEECLLFVELWSRYAVGWWGPAGHGANPLPCFLQDFKVTRTESGHHLSLCLPAGSATWQCIWRVLSQTALHQTASHPVQAACCPSLQSAENWC
jgi:hypothetical protein